MKRIFRMLSMLLCVVMLLSLFPAGAFAEELSVVDNAAFGASAGDGMTQIPYISNFDLRDTWNLPDWGSGCYTSCVTMVLQTLGKNVTPKDIWTLNGNTTYISSWDRIATTYDVEMTSQTKLSGSASNRQDTIRNVLRSLPETQQLLLVYVKPNCKENKTAHMVVMFLDSNNTLRIHDPGLKNGNSITIESTYMMGLYGSNDEKWENVTDYRIIKARNATPVTPDLIVTFDANGGTGTMNAIDISVGGTFTVPDCSFEKNGYTCNRFTLHRSDGKWLSNTGAFVSDLENTGLEYFQCGLDCTFENTWIEEGEYAYSFVADWRIADSIVQSESELRTALVSSGGEIIPSRYITLSNDLTIPEGKSVSLIDNVLTIPEGVTVINNGTLIIGGSYSGSGYLNKSGMMVVDGSFENHGDVYFISGKIEQNGSFKNNGFVGLRLVGLSEGNTVAYFINKGILENNGTIDWYNPFPENPFNANFFNQGTFDGIIDAEESYISNIPADQINLHVTIDNEEDLHNCLDIGYHYLDIRCYDPLTLSQDLYLPDNTLFSFGDWNRNINLTIPKGITATFESSPFCSFAPDGSLATIIVDGELYLPNQTTLGEHGTINVSGKLAIGSKNDENGEYFQSWLDASGTISILDGGELVNYSSVKADILSISENATVHNYGKIKGINTIDETVFPDSTFRQYVKNFDTDNNDYFNENEIASITVLDCSRYKNITSLKGIELFPMLEELNCNYNQITELDVSKNHALQKLYCYSNQLTTLNVSQNSELQELFCGQNQLNTLELGTKNKLEVLNCERNNLESINVKQCPNLAVLSCYDNQLKALDVSSNNELQLLSCYNNALESIVLGEHPKLNSLNCSQNHIKQLTVDKCGALSSLVCWGNELEQLNVKSLKNLTVLGCDSNKIASLNVESNTKLQELYCYNNNLASLSVSNNPDLWLLWCGENTFTSLDLTKNAKLEDFQCYDGQLTSLALGSKPALLRLSVDGNALSSLDVSAANALVRLDCANNHLTQLILGTHNALEQLDCSGNQLKSINVTNCAKLVQLMQDVVPITENGVIGYEFAIDEDYIRYFWYDEGVQLSESAITPDLTLPAALTTIESEAFAGGGFNSVLIPPTVKTIAPDAFGDRTDLIILGTSGSYAETFAGLKNYTFVPAA